MQLENHTTILARTHRVHNLFETLVTHVKEDIEIVTEYVIN